MKTSSKYNLSEIMKRAHRFYRRNKGELSFSQCLKNSWTLEKAHMSTSDYIEKSNARYAAKMRGFKLDKATPCEKYNDLAIPASAFYSNNNRGHMGSKYVGD